METRNKFAMAESTTTEHLSLPSRLPLGGLSDRGAVLAILFTFVSTTSSSLAGK